MGGNDRYKSPFDRGANRTGIIATVSAHALLLLAAVGTCLEYSPPSRKTEGMLIEFEEPEPPVKTPILTAAGVEPKADNDGIREETRLVQRSESVIPLPESENTGDETEIGPDGDIPVPEPEREKQINKRALFSSSRNKKDTLAVQVAEEVTDALQAGHPKGNTAAGNTDGRPTARLEGRTVMGNLPLPAYSVEKSGTVVVRILVDQYGTVINAIPGVQGTNVQDARLWASAKEAALEAKFNTSSSAPPVQEGTITYIFTLK